MSQSRLVLATRANQAALLPALVLATSINVGRVSQEVVIAYEDTAVLHEGENAIVQFTGASGKSVFGAEQVVQELIASYPYLHGKEEKLVNAAVFFCYLLFRCHLLLLFYFFDWITDWPRYRRTGGSVSLGLCRLSISRRSIRSCNVSMHS